jgi:acetyl-CoA carboxylase biotin carboxyl carrier protein
LTEDDIERLVRLIEALDSSTFDYLQLQVGSIKVTLGKGAVPMSAAAFAMPAAAPVHAATAPAVAAPVHAATAPVHAGAAPAAAAPVHAATAPAAPSSSPPPQRTSGAAAPPSAQSAPSRKRAAAAASAATSTGTIEIKAQIMGMFYAQPEPGAPPFVSIGAEVKEDTTVCLIEVMKTFNAMTAGVKGVITEICAENAQLVEYGQVLFRVRPS